MNEPEVSKEPDATPDPVASSPTPTPETQPLVTTFHRLWGRLKAHKVVQWTLAYLAIAYTLLHGAEMLAGTLNWSHGLLRLFTLILILGVPVIITLAWYHGARGLQRVSGTEIMIIAILLALGGAFLWRDSTDHEEVPATAAVATPAPAEALSDALIVPDDKSIAVLPFVNMSSDPEQEYFSDGLAEQVLNLLSKVPELRVIARTSSFAFKGKEDVDMATIGQRLNVAHVLEGSVRKSANRVRITAQLIEVADSSHQWSETYDRELTDIFAIQDEIALAVVDQLKLALLSDDLLTRSTTTSPEAYNFYLQGRHFLHQSSETSLVKAAELFGKAIAADPAYVQAWAELAYVQMSMANAGVGFKEQASGFDKARTSVQKALDLDPDLARAHHVLGWIQYSADWDWSKADASFEKALALDPSDAESLSFLGYLAVMQGALDAGIELSKRAVALDPVAVNPRYSLAYAYSIVGRFDEAENEIRAGLELSPDATGGWASLGIILLQKGQAAPALKMMVKETAENARLIGLSLAYHAVGQKEASDAALNELIEKYAGIAAYQVATAYAYRGEKEMAFDWIDRAYRQRDSGMPSLGTDPLMENIKDDPRYAAMLRKLKLPAVNYLDG